MFRTEALAELRDVIDDTREPYGWSDLRLTRFLSLGQDQFCKDTGFFADNTNFPLTTVAGTSTYAIDSRIIEIKELWYGEFRLTKFFQSQRQSLLDTTSEFPELGTSTPGMPYGWQTDQETGLLTLYPEPDAVYSLNQRVWRKSRKPLTRKTGVVSLGGTLHVGDTITVSINGSVFSYTVLAGDASLTSVAIALAAVIDASTSFVSTASGQVISIASSNYALSTATTVVVTGSGATTTAVAADDYSAEFEIPEDFHFAPIEWAAGKALGDHDSELTNPKKAAEHYANYHALAREGKRAYRRLCGGVPEFIPNPLYLV